jgi:uncharacterized protein (TIGR00369 family)
MGQIAPSWALADRVSGCAPALARYDQADDGNNKGLHHMALMDGVRYGLATPGEVHGLSGLEILRAMIEGRLPAPPICQGMTFRLTEADEGRVIFTGEPGKHLLNPLGGVHGGWALTLVDSATGCAAFSTLPPGAAYTTVETKANFVRAISHDTGLVTCTAEVLARGRQIITAEAKMTDGAGKLLAHGSSTLIVLPPRG